jgi:RNA polymerase sigma-70 factor, ECF subfamily
VNSLLEDWVPRVYRFALRLTGDPGAAEELTQETFLRAWRSRSRLRDARAARVWLFRIAANVWRDQLRRGRSPVAQARLLDDVEPARAPPPERLAAGREELSRALDAMAALPARQREVLHLSACEGLSTAEVAEVLGISAAATKASLSLARKKLRELLLDPTIDPTSAKGPSP